MYIDTVPNRNSPPAILLRESFRQHGKVKKRTIANLSKCPDHVVDGLRILLKGGIALRSPNELLSILRSYPHGHVGAVLGSLHQLGLHSLIARPASRQRDLVLAMIVARVVDARSKLATARGLNPESAVSSLGHLLQWGPSTRMNCTPRWTGWWLASTASSSAWRSAICMTTRSCCTT